MLNISKTTNNLGRREYSKRQKSKHHLSSGCHLADMLLQQPVSYAGLQLWCAWAPNGAFAFPIWCGHGLCVPTGPVSHYRVIH